MRPMKHLLFLMLDNQNLFSQGLCHWARNLHNYKIIDYQEMLRLLDYIKKNKPVYRFNHRYYWEVGEIEPRIEWVEEQISFFNINFEDQIA